MKNIVRYAFILLALGYGAVANAQNTPEITLTLGNVQDDNLAQRTWKYNLVSCTADATTRITSVLISMINNNIPNDPSAPSGSGTMRVNKSDGHNPRTILYVFGSSVTPAQAADFIGRIIFQRTNLADDANATPNVNITVDANPTSLPQGATITVWNHPDGSLHYYVWVQEYSIRYKKAYEDAKKYYFQGMRGYLATITGKLENERLKQIATLEGWSGGARTQDIIADSTRIPGNTNDRVPTMTPTNGYGNDPDSLGRYYRWLCGPETGFKYYYHAPNNAANSTGGDSNPLRSWRVGNAYTAWNGTVGQPDQEPNNNDRDRGGENVMQVNFSTGRNWNDYAPYNTAIRGYFIEFGGNGEEYTVETEVSPGNFITATYPPNPFYNTPTEPTTNNQWEGFSPGNKVTTVTTFRTSTMHSNVLVIE